MKCPHCDEDIPDDSEFCPKCDELVDESIGDTIIDKSVHILRHEEAGSHYYQFYTNVMKAYGLYIMDDAIDSFFPGITEFNYTEEIEEEEKEEIELEMPIFGPLQPLMEEEGIAQGFNECLKKCLEKQFKGREEELKEIFENRKDEIWNEMKQWVAKLIGIRHGASEEFLQEQSIVALQIAIETYIRSILIDIIQNDSDIARCFYDEARGLKPEQVVRAFLQRSSLAEEVINEIPASRLIDIIRDFLKIPINKTDQINAFYKVILIRNVLVHNNGVMNERNAQFGKDKGIQLALDEGGHIIIDNELILELFNLSIDIIDDIQEWFVEKYF